MTTTDSCMGTTGIRVSLNALPHGKARVWVSKECLPRIEEKRKPPVYALRQFQFGYDCKSRSNVFPCLARGIRALFRVSGRNIRRNMALRSHFPGEIVLISPGFPSLGDLFSVSLRNSQILSANYGISKSVFTKSGISPFPK